MSTTITISAENVDMNLLYRQKLLLLKALAYFKSFGTDEYEDLEGLVNLIDDIGDDAERRGVWKYPELQTDRLCEE